MLVSKACFQLFIYSLTIKVSQLFFPPIFLTLLSRQGLPLSSTEFLYKSLSKFHCGQGFKL